MASYCTISQIKDVGRLNIESDSQNDVLRSLAETASRWIDRWFDLPENAFKASTESTRYYSPSHLAGNILRLDDPIVVIGSITDASGSSVDTANIRLLPRNKSFYWYLQLTTGDDWPAGSEFDETEVTAKFGYSTTVPILVQEATASLAGWFSKRYQAALQDRLASMEMGEMQYSDQMPKQVEQMLYPLKREIYEYVR